MDTDEDYHAAYIPFEVGHASRLFTVILNGFTDGIPNAVLLLSSFCVFYLISR